MSLIDVEEKKKNTRREKNLSSTPVVATWIIIITIALSFTKEKKKYNEKAQRLQYRALK